MIPRPADNHLAAPFLVVEAARCWRRAKDQGRPAMPCLHALLRAEGGDILAPVFASLLFLCETALGRALCVGGHHRVSEDEALLIDLLDGARHPRACFACAGEIVTTLDRALASTRVMVRLAREAPGPALAPALY
jgi:hypothetical protein